VSTANREKVIYLGFSAKRRTQGYKQAKIYTHMLVYMAKLYLLCLPVILCEHRKGDFQVFSWDSQV
jgi:hypothetical protein